MANLTFTLDQVNEIVTDVQSRELLDVIGVAERLHVEPAEVRDWAGRGLLPAKKIGGRYIFSLDEVIRWHLTCLQQLSESPRVRPALEVFF